MKKNAAKERGRKRNTFACSCFMKVPRPAYAEIFIFDDLLYSNGAAYPFFRVIRNSCNEKLLPGNLTPKRNFRIVSRVGNLIKNVSV